jgi:hypothetical protein
MVVGVHVYMGRLMMQFTSSLLVNGTLELSEVTHESIQVNVMNCPLFVKAQRK